MEFIIQNFDFICTVIRQSKKRISLIQNIQIDEKMNFEDLDAQLAALQAELKSDIKKVFIISEQQLWCLN